MSDTKVPGIKAQHAIITDTCRENRGRAEAFDEAARRLREEYLACQEGNPEGSGARFHVVLTVEPGER